MPHLINYYQHPNKALFWREICKMAAWQFGTREYARSAAMAAAVSRTSTFGRAGWTEGLGFGSGTATAAVLSCCVSRGGVGVGAGRENDCTAASVGFGAGFSSDFK